MNLTFAILMWLIGTKLGMGPEYYAVILFGVFVHIYGIAVRRIEKNDSSDETNRTP